MAKRRAEQETVDGDTPIIAVPTVSDEIKPALPWYGPGYSTEPDKGGGFWGGVVSVVTAPVKAVAAAGGVVVHAVETVAAPVVNAAGAVVEVVRENPVAQVVAAAATGGLSLVAQAGIEAATGNGGPVTGFFDKAVHDPLSIVTELPGTLLTETGLVGLVADGASAVGAATHELFGDSTVGNIGGAIHSAVEDVQGSARDNPVASLEVIGGILLTAVGVPVGPGLIGAGASQIANGALPSSAQQPTNTNPGIVPPAPAQLSLPTTPALSDAAAPSSFIARNWQVLAGAAALAALGGLAAWSSQRQPSPT